MNQFTLLQQAGAGGGNLFSVLMLYGAIFAIFYFFLIRPQRKKQREVLNMQNSVEVGQWVLTTGGLYGKIVDIVNQHVLIIEFGTNKSVRIPMERTAIASVTEPELTSVKEVKENEEEK